MKKINLKGISEVLSEKELKNVMGGSGDSGGGPCASFKCSCRNGANPPYVSSWSKSYCKSEEMTRDITQRCSGGQGGCSAG